MSKRLNAELLSYIRKHQALFISFSLVTDVVNLLFLMAKLAQLLTSVFLVYAILESILVTKSKN